MTRVFRSGRGGRFFLLVILVAALVTAVGVWRLQGGTASAQPAPGLKASRGDLTVTVGGVGRIVQAGEPTQAPPAAGSSTASAGETPGSAVFPQVSGQVTEFLVSPGDRVVAGEPLAVLDDGGVAAGAISQARIDLDVAQLERRQKRASDPLKGTPPTRAELAAAAASVISARVRLGRVLLPPRAGDVSTARHDVKRAEADLETTLGGTPEARADAILIAEQSVELAQARLDRILAPPHPADIAVAEAEVQKAEADLEALVRSDRTQPVTKKEIDAATAAIKAARLKLERLLAPPGAADVTAARVELERARVELRRIQAGPSHAALEAARQAVDAANARLEQLLSPALASDVSSARLSSALAAAGPLTVRAPRRGTITALLTTLGAHVDPPTSMVVMADLERLEVRVDLSEFDIARVKRGQPATVSVDALGGQSFRGDVLFAALAGTNTSGVVTFPVQVGLADAPGLKPGMNVSVRIVVANRRNVLQLPLEAVTQEGGEATVTVLRRSDQPISRTVKLGLANNKSVEIVKGLRAGERVVLEESGGGGGE